MDPGCVDAIIPTSKIACQTLTQVDVLPRVIPAHIVHPVVDDEHIPIRYFANNNLSPGIFLIYYKFLAVGSQGRIYRRAIFILYSLCFALPTTASTRSNRRFFVLYLKHPASNMKTYPVHV